MVDTFHDEAEEALRVAEVLGKDMGAVRLDTPAERGGVTEGWCARCGQGWTWPVLIT